jgi:hypothetical protein
MGIPLVCYRWATRSSDKIAAVGRNWHVTIHHLYHSEVSGPLSSRRRTNCANAPPEHTSPLIAILIKSAGIGNSDRY